MSGDGGKEAEGGCSGREEGRPVHRTGPGGGRLSRGGLYHVLTSLLALEAPCRACASDSAHWASWGSVWMIPHPKESWASSGIPCADAGTKKP